jgi:hypothetical protein
MIPSTFVIAGLDPAIHLFKTMDARIKSAHDSAVVEVAR